MRQNTIRFLDYWIGQPVCWLLTRHRDIFESKSKEQNPPRRILFIKLIEQGATVLANSAIDRAIQLVGRENVFFCVFAENKFILEVMGKIPNQNIISLDLSHPWRLGFEIFRLLRAARQLEIDTVIDLEFFARGSAILSYLTRASRRVGLHRFTCEYPYRGDLMTHRVHYNPYLHTAKTYRLLVEALQLNEEDLPLAKLPQTVLETSTPYFSPSFEEKNRLKESVFQIARREINGPIVILNPNAGDLMPLRRWPSDRFIALGRRLLAEHSDVTVALTGGPIEEAAVTAISKELGTERVVNLAGKTTLREVMVLYTLADILVTNDSGPAHFASMTGIDVIVLFGPETPKLFGPLGPRIHALSAELSCSPCVNVLNHRNSPCTNNVCMQLIEVRTVYEKVEERLKARAKGKQEEEISLPSGPFHSRNLNPDADPLLRH
jgi:ADP-heptose:LPS heptosyltransferase